MTAESTGALIRYGVLHRSKGELYSHAPMADGYWTPWHLAQAAFADLEARVRFYEQHTDKQANELVEVTLQRDKWVAAFNRSEQFQDGPRKRAEAVESQLAALRAALEPIARCEHERAVGANGLFSVEHWKHNAGQEHPHEPDDDSFIAFENCKHPLCASVRSADPCRVEPVRIGAFDYVENADGTVTRKDWRDE